MDEPVAPSSHRASPLDPTYDQLLASVRKRFESVTGSSRGRPRLLVTRAPDLYATFLDALSPELRRENTCHACRRFLERFGNIVHVTEKGKTVSALWDREGTPKPYVDAIGALEAAVSRAPIEGVFLSSQATWGTPMTGEWSHLSIVPPKSFITKPSALKTTSQEIAEKKHEHETLLRGLTEFPIELTRKAHSLLTTGALYRSEKCIGTAKWLLDLHEQRNTAKNIRAKEALTWIAVLGAPPGFCHVRSTMIGTLLEDLAADLPFAEIKTKFDAKMHPLQYQRPTAAPAAGNIAQAEKIVAKLKSAGALERRFARLDDIQKLWMPAAPERDPEKKGVFSHLKAKGTHAVADVDAPTTVMTWEKFAKTILPTAQSIDYFVPDSKQSYLGMVTAKNPEAPPILQWDSEEKRNPVSSYVYNGGSTPERWNLKPNVYHPVTAVALQPSMWDASKSFSHQSSTVIFLLEGAKDTEYTKGAGFFPEYLKSEYHAIRATIEAHTKGAVIADKDQASACGIGLSKGGKWNQTFRVTSKDGMRLTYQLDRWD